MQPITSMKYLLSVNNHLSYHKVARLELKRAVFLEKGGALSCYQLVG